MKVNERFLLSTVAVVFVAFATGVALSGGSSTHVTAVVAVGIGLVTAALVQVRQSRDGTLILRDPRDRAANSTRIARGRSRLASVAAGLAIAGTAMLGAHGRVHLIGVAAAEVVCGFVLGLMPVLLWIAFSLRPDERHGQQL